MLLERVVGEGPEELRFELSGKEPHKAGDWSSPGRVVQQVKPLR